jgi:hypothetical protein
MAQLGTKKINNAKAWTSDEDEQLRKLIISNVSAGSFLKSRQPGCRLNASADNRTTPRRINVA